MLLLPYPRDSLLKHLPKNANVAEIGVSEGAFSQQIIDETSPANLVLIDPWVHQDRQDYQLDETNAPQEVMQSRYESVVSKFGHLDNVTVQRTESLAAASGIRNSGHLFDWVYIDAVHSYEGCSEDLYAWADCVSPDGMMLGHDFSAHELSSAQEFGVAEAVRDFCAQTEWDMIALTNEAWGTYVLTQSPIAIGRLVSKLISSTLGLVNITNFWNMDFKQELIPTPEGFMTINGWPVSVFTIGGGDEDPAMR